MLLLYVWVIFALRAKITHKKENSVSANSRYYIRSLFERDDGQGQPMIARSPKDRKQKFIISRRSERELAASAASAARYLYYGAGALGLVLVVVGLVR